MNGCEYCLEKRYLFINCQEIDEGFFISNNHIYVTDEYLENANKDNDDQNSLGIKVKSATLENYRKEGIQFPPNMYYNKVKQINYCPMCGRKLGSD